MSKGSKARPLSVSRQTFADNFERVFGQHKPIALCRQGSGDVIAYACGRCGVVAASVITHGDQARKEAESHCGPWICEKCGGENTSRYYCATCSLRSIRKSAQKALAEAEDVTETYDGPVVIGDSYHSSVEDAADSVDGPTWAYACTEYDAVEIDAIHLLECALEEHHEGAIDEVDVDALQVALDAWCAAQSVATFHEDNTRKVLVCPEPWKECDDGCECIACDRRRELSKESLPKLDQAN